MIILDTNVISELMRPRPETQVVGWVDAQPTSSLFTTAITEAELLLGVCLLPAGKRRALLEEAVLQMLVEDFRNRILPFDSMATRHFAELVSSRRRAGHPMLHADAQIAAIARGHGAALATRNVTDFEGCGLTLVNPWHR